MPDFQKIGIPALPAAVGITHLRVYDTPSPDGLHGGSPHLHFACTEAYWVVAGKGAVQTLDATGYRETPLEPGQLTWFSPGVIHRLINLDGALEILVVMQNAGLPEAGDFVLTFPEALLQNKSEYARHAALTQSGEVYASGEAVAAARRDLAVTGFHELRERFERDGEAALRAFYTAGLEVIRPQLSLWMDKWKQGPVEATTATGNQLDALAQGNIQHLLSGRIQTLAPESQRRLGMCGTLGTYLPEGLIQ